MHKNGNYARPRGTVGVCKIQKNKKKSKNKKEKQQKKNILKAIFR